MLQLELNKLTEETNRMNARIEMDNCMQELRSYLGIQSDEELKVKNQRPRTRLQCRTARSLITGQRKQSGNTKHDTPETGERKQRVVRPCQCRTESGYLSAFRPDTNCRQAGKRLQEAIGPAVRQPECSTTHPRLGTGQGQSARGTLNRDLVYTQVEQDKTDFELNIRKLVKQFNLQAQRVRIAARTDETAQRRSDVARKLYLLGKSTILDLNASITEKDQARRNYITALYNYWSLYYTLRSLTLFDFEGKTPLTENYDLLID